jgi:ectoine hydroxylase-related dioxygenase (phytanoyl-CoA dioxygenase family)
MRVYNQRPLDASPRITSLWMLSDFTKYNGGTWVVPGSHKLQLDVDHPAAVRHHNNLHLHCF